MWESPIKQITTEMQFMYENECMKVVQGFGFDVDKEELIKALQYDRKQYEKGYADGYAKAIDEFAEALKERLVGMQMAELQGEDVCPCAETGEDCPYMNQDIGCQYCAREQTIKDIDEIAEQLKGVRNE